MNLVVFTVCWLSEELALLDGLVLLSVPVTSRVKLLVVLAWVIEIVARHLNDLLPLLSDFLVLDFGEATLDGCDQVDLLTPAGSFERRLDDKVTIVVTDELRQLCRLTYDSDEVRLRLRVSVDKASLDDARRVLLNAQLGDLGDELLKDRFTDVRVPLFQDNANCVIAVGIRNELDQISLDFLYNSLSLLVGSRL